LLTQSANSRYDFHRAHDCLVHRSYSMVSALDAARLVASSAPAPKRARSYPYPHAWCLSETYCTRATTILGDHLTRLAFARWHYPLALGVKAAGDGAFLNAARLTASSLLFAATPRVLLGAAQARRFSLAISQPNPARLPLSAAADCYLTAPVTSLTGSISAVCYASAPNRSSDAGAQLKSTISPASFTPCASRLCQI
jgi:hypothetical protein